MLLTGKTGDILIKELISFLLEWYADNKRSFPWRGIRDAYKIAISEILLQQTFARKVVPVYRALVYQYPTVYDLANADSGKIKEMIRPLGLLYRSDVLVEFAKVVVQDFGGVIPSEEKQLRQLKGIGAYASAAIRCHAYNDKIIPIDTNIQRIICRVWGLTYPVKTVAIRKQVEGICSKIADELPSTKDIHYAMLDFAAEVCTFYSPHNEQCPLNVFCTYAMKKDKNV